jgi:integrase
MASQTPRLEKTRTPGIYKRGGSYVVTFRDPQGRARKRFARTMAEARDLKASLRADVSRGEYRAQSKASFAEYAAEWIDTYAGRTRRGIGPETRDDYRRVLERDAIPFFGRKRLAEIEPRDLRQYALRVSRRGVSAGTVRLALAPVKALLATAAEDGLIRFNPAHGLRNLLPAAAARTEEEEKVKALAEDELRRLLDELPDRWRPFFEFLSQTGLRIGEAIELRFGDVDVGRARLNVQRRVYRGRVDLPKGRKSRKVRLSGPMGQLLWNLRGNAEDGELVFRADQGGRIDHSNLMRRVLKPAAVRAGLGEWVRSGNRGKLRPESWVGFHTFRHTCATMLFRRGWNAAQVQKFLGHTDPGFTLRTYIHLLDDDLPEPSFEELGDTVGNERATGEAENGRDATAAEAPAFRVLEGESPDEPRAAESAVAYS